PGGRARGAADPPPLPPRWCNVVGRWAKIWGEGDARSVWLAGTLLVAERPARLLDPHLPRQAQRLVLEAVRQALRPLPPREERDTSTAPGQGESWRPPRVPPTRSLATALPSGAREGPPPPARPRG